MLFTEVRFLFYFLPLSLLLFRWSLRFSGGRFSSLPRIAIFLLTAVFYGFKEPWWLLPFGVCIGFDFLWASLLTRVVSPRKRSWILACSITQSLGLLGVFKYWPWLCQLAPRFFPGLEGALPQLLQEGASVSLPPGISFYTFESMSFVIDVYRREVTPPKSPLEFFAFIGMYPRFVAGPIVRYREMVGQFQNYRGMQVEDGLFLFLVGFFLKGGFADSFSYFTRYAFDTQVAPGCLAAWVGVAAYTLQIYFDFSGYSLMAIGLGRCLGFQFPNNFNKPYTATSIQDFWHRWHRTLSLWLRDYLYIPLGGSRRGPVRTYVNLFLTMLLGGLWHGAAGKYLVWGAWHGTLLCVERRTGSDRLLPRSLYRLLTFVAVMVGWIFFRVEHGLPQAGKILQAMFCFWHSSQAFDAEPILANPLLSGLALAGVVYCFGIEPRIDVQAMERADYVSWASRLGAAALFAVAALIAFSSRTIPFLYFQF